MTADELAKRTERAIKDVQTAVNAARIAKNKIAQEKSENVLSVLLVLSGRKR